LVATASVLLAVGFEKTSDGALRSAHDESHGGFVAAARCGVVASHCLHHPLTPSSWRRGAERNPLLDKEGMKGWWN